MKVREAMETHVKVTAPETDLAMAGKLMAEGGCGVLPVVDDTKRVVGIVTDRDICVYLSRRDEKPSRTRVESVMQQDVHACHPSDDIREALNMMKAWRVRRLPVVDERGELVGIVSLDEVVLRAQAFETSGFHGPFYVDIASTLQAICRHPSHVGH